MQPQICEKGPQGLLNDMNAAAAEAPAWTSLGFTRPTTVSKRENEADVLSHGEQWVHSGGLLHPQAVTKDGVERVSRPGNKLKAAATKNIKSTFHTLFVV